MDGWKGGARGKISHVLLRNLCREADFCKQDLVVGRIETYGEQIHFH